jgi:hypothetical protein
MTGKRALRVYCLKTVWMYTSVSIIHGGFDYAV